MFRSYRRWKKKRAINKVKPGDGHPLKEYRWWQIFTRSLFYLRMTEDDGTLNVYAVNVNYFSENETTELYLNGRHHATSTLPATFPVGEGVIEVATTSIGLRKMHYVTEEAEQQLSPHPRSMEGLRMRFGRRFPDLSKLIGIAAAAILLVSLILGLPQLVALITQIDFISERFGTFESPIVLPEWLNWTLIVGSTLAAFERAITLRNHWLIDMDTWWDD